MLRRALTILSLTGLLLSVGLWGVSYHGIMYVGDVHSCLLANGTISAQFKSFASVRARESYLQSSTATLPTRWVWGIIVPPSFSPMWFPTWESHWLANNPYRPKVTAVSLPMWISTAALLIVFVLLYAPIRGERRRRKRKKLGLCLKCGYDLRASKDICPECGGEFGSTGVDS